MKMVLDTEKVKNQLQWVNRNTLNYEANELFDLIMSLDHEIVPQMIVEKDEYEMLGGHL